jgi:hypothetical protein
MTDTFGMIFAVVQYILLSFIGVSATLFVPLPIDQQINESDGVVWGKFIGAQYKKLPSGEVTTVGSFKVIKQSGLKYKHFLNRNKLDVLYPGGKWQGIQYKVHGSPEFLPGEEVVLLLKKTPFGFVISNMSLGKYSITKEKKGVFFKSTVYGDHKQLGKIDLVAFNGFLNKKFGNSFDDLPSFRKSIASKNKDQGREIASIQESKSPFLLKGVSIFWLVICLTILGFTSQKIYRKWLRS